MENLYLAPGATPGTNSSQTPAPPSDRMGWARPSQKLKSPTRRTPRAFGAQTANAVPAAFALHGPRAERVPQLLVPSLADQVQVELAERRQVPVRVVLQLRVAVDIGDLKPIIRNGPGFPWHGHLEHAQVAVRHRVPAAIGQHRGHGGGERAQCPDHCAFHLGAVAGHGVGAEHRVRVVVLTSDKSLDLAKGDRFVFR